MCSLILENDLAVLTKILTALYADFFFIVSQSDGDIGIFAGDSLQITDYSGDFRDSRLNEAKDIVLIAAGTGVLLVIIIIIEASIPISQAVCQWASESVSQWASQWVSQWVSESVSQWVSQWQWVSQSVSVSVSNCNSNSNSKSLLRLTLQRKVSVILQ